MFEKSTADAQPIPDPPRRMPAKRLRQTLYWLALDWIHLSSSLPSAGAASVRRWELARHSNVRDYGHPSEWASVKAAEIANMMTGWHDYLSEHRDETRPRRKLMRIRPDEGTDYDVWAYAVNEQQRLVSAWKYLEPRCEQLVGLVDAEALKELPDLHNGIRRTLGAAQPRYTLPVPCPNMDCELRTLVRVQGVGQDFISCDSCGYTIKEAYYPLLIEMTLDAFLSSST
jgi:hypothetical protein